MRQEESRMRDNTAANFEKPARTKAFLAGLAGFALVAGVAGGYWMSGGGETALATEETTTTLKAEAPTTNPSSDVGPFDIEDSTTTSLQPQPPENDDDQPDVEPAPDPEPAQLAVDDSVDVADTGEGSFTIHNIGGDALDIESITGPAAISMSDAPMSLGGGESVDIEITVDTSGLPFGEYEMELEVNTSVGSETVTVSGEKFAIIVPLPPIPDVDVQDVVVVPHLSPVAPITIWNNEDYDVDVTLESLSARLTLPAEFTLLPGKNVIPGVITPFGLPAHITQNLDFEVSWWLGSEQATVVKFGQ